MTKQVVGTYNSENSVIEAIQELKSKGYDYNDMSIITNNQENRHFLEYRTEAAVHDMSKDMSLTEKIKSAFNDGESDNLEKKLVDIGVSKNEATSYASDVNEGKILLIVDSVNDIGYKQRDESLAGTTEVDNGGVYSSAGETFSLDNRDRLKDESGEEKAIHLREEQLKVDKEEVKTGEVKIKKEVVEEQEKLNIPVKHEEVYVERRSVSQEGTEANPIENDETIRVPVYEEQVEVTKKPVVTDEIIIGKRTVEETQQVVDTVKKEKAHIEQDGNPLVEGNHKLKD
ncbi:uncharacterized protein (TIGR02271 family) [Bacillus fengqiuensis]|nr:uncharacterized protein (TIGR02271 family) [Bacillus fengqiuensis]